MDEFQLNKDYISLEDIPPGKNGFIDLDAFPKDKIFINSILRFPKLTDRHGICAVTKELPLHLLYSAYTQGVFPWFDETKGEPVIWYNPDPRFCLKQKDFHIPKSVARFLKHTPYTYTMDKCFKKVMECCGDIKRTGQTGSWIGPKMIEAYEILHKAGVAHSIEVWHNGELAGGFYGELLGSVFCGESMFSKESNTAKSAFVLFAKCFFDCGGKLIDSQVYTDNIARFGAKNISRQAFLLLESEYLNKPLSKDLKDSFEHCI